MGNFKTKTYRLSDGTSVTLRQGTKSDAERMKYCVTEYIRENSGQVWDIGEFSPTLEFEEKWIEEMLDHPCEILLVAVLDGKIVGNIDFHIGKRKRIAHVGEFGMAVLPEFKGKGIGSLLLQELLNWAKSTDGVEKINLRVLANNKAAVRLYSKFNFKEEARKKNEIKYSDGTYTDEVHMSLFL